MPSDRPAPITEAAFQKLVITAAKAAGWRVAHVERAQRRPGKWTTPTTAGLPDLILLRPPQLVFLELKKEKGDPTPAQTEWVAGLQACPGVEAFIVRPSDTDEILALLARPRRNPPDLTPPTMLTEPTKETTAP